MRDIQYAHSAFVPVYLCKLFHGFGLLDRYLAACPSEVSEDSEWEAIYVALFCVSDTVWDNYLDDFMAQKYYFSDGAMREYYRLCRSYCKQFGVSLKENPYMKKASDHFCKAMLDVDGDCWGYLHTKINHDYASGVFFIYGEESFDSHIELIGALLKIFSFYKYELPKLKAELGLLDTSTKKEAT